MIYLCAMNNLTKKVETWVFESPLAEPDIAWTKRAYTVDRYSDRHGTVIWRGINVKWYFSDGWFLVKSEDSPWIPCDEPIYETIRNESTL
mgnify:FL=1